MGKRKGQNSTAKTVTNSPCELDGCNCPAGCIEKEPIDIDHPPSEDAVLMDCSAGIKCPMNKHLHPKCYEQLEIELIRLMQGAPGHSRHLTDEQCRRSMWQRHSGYELIFKRCRCACGGFLKRCDKQEAESATVVSADGASDAAKSKKKKGKTKKELPKLSVPNFNLVGSSSYSRKVPITNSLHKQPEIDEAVENENKRQVYIPGLLNKDSSSAAFPATQPGKFCQKSIKSKKVQPEVDSPKDDSLIAAIFEPIPQHCSSDIYYDVVKFVDLEKYFKKAVDLFDAL